MGINYRRNSVFILAPDEDILSAKIADLRICFKPAEQVVGDGITADHLALDHGQATILSVADKVFTIIAYHPQLNIYYTKEFKGLSYVPYEVLQGVEHVDLCVTDGTTNIVYYVQGAPDGISISDGSSYMLINEQGTEWFVGRIIEPFNLIFAQLPAQKGSLKISDGAGHVLSGDSAGLVFTNTPTSNGIRLPVAYSLELAGNYLRLTKPDQPISKTVDGIRSINGVTPVGGNISIKVLG